MVGSHRVEPKSKDERTDVKMSEKKERKMTPKMFLHRANGKISAQAFLAQHREFLCTGELALFTSPILAKVDSQELLPTPGLDEIKRIVLSHHLTEETRKAEAAMSKAQEGGGSRKPYLGEIRSKDGLILHEQAFNTPQECEGWLDRRLFEGEPECFGICTAQYLLDKHGDPMTIVILRQDAIARILKKGKTPIMKSKPKSTNSLGFGVKVSQSVARFSRG